MYYIYRITNKINGKTYIGQHKYKSLNDNYMGSGKLIKRAQKKYGIESFEKEILYSRIQYKETADDMERFAIAKERALGKAEYNLANGGQGGNGGANKGKHPSEETRRKLSEAKKGKTPWNKGKMMSDEMKKKLSESTKGKHLSEETKRKMSEARKGHLGYWLGKHRSEETRKKMSEAQKGRQSSMKGKHRSEDFRKKISEYRKGKPSPTKGKRWKLVDGKRVYY